jgi:hypothetical protein
MSTYRVDWDCCGSVSETDSWEPEECPFCAGYKLRKEIERLRYLVEIAYREGWEDGFENDAHSQDRNWKSSHAFRALKEDWA